MATRGAKILTLDEAKHLRYSLPKSWIRAAGLMKHKKVDLQRYLAGETASLYSSKRDLAAWTAIQGIWKKKKIVSPVAWQRKIRKEWERRLV